MTSAAAITDDTVAGLDAQALAEQLRQRASELGFGLCGIAPAVAPTTLGEFQQWLRQGYDGEMAYLKRREEAYQSPDGVLSGVRTVIMLGLNYHVAERPPSLTTSPAESSAESPAKIPIGRVARYAWSPTDYHDLLRNRLHQLAATLHEHRPGCRTRTVVDTAPLLERDFARRAGLGWFGKNTMLINRNVGSWMFLAALLTDVELPADAPHHTSHCGTCTRCLDACPTQAFPQPYVLDATRCISYLTIELRNQPIPESLREGMGEWLFGCDVCNEVCPWNGKAPSSTDADLQPIPSLAAADAAELLTLSPEAFRQRFAKTPLSRPGRDGLLRNACIVLGNSGDPSHLDPLRQMLLDDSPLIREAATWAIAQLSSSDETAERGGASGNVEEHLERPR